MAKKKQLITQHYSSLTEAVAGMSKPFKNARNAYIANEHYAGRRGSDWYGVDATAEGIVRMATVDGWPEGGKAMRLFHERMHAKLPRALGFMRTKRKGEQGDELDYHATLRGAHDKAWTHSQRTIRKGSGILRLCVDVAGNRSQEASRLKWRGIAGAALAEIMRKAGYSVEIQAVLATSAPDVHSTIDTYTSIVVKSRKTTVDFDQLAATIGLAGFYRVVGFHTICRGCDIAGKEAGASLGFYLSAEATAPLDPKVTTLFVSPEVMSEDSAVEWVKRSVQLLQGARA